MVYKTEFGFTLTCDPNKGLPSGQGPGAKALAMVGQETVQANAPAQKQDDADWMAKPFKPAGC
jgi:hypothetical protein